MQIALLSAPGFIEWERGGCFPSHIPGLIPEPGPLSMTGPPPEPGVLPIAGPLTMIGLLPKPGQPPMRGLLPES